MQDAGGWRLGAAGTQRTGCCQRCHSRWGPSTVVLRGGRTGSSCRRSLQRGDQPARPRAERPGGAARVGQSGPPLFRVEGFPPAKRLTHSYSTPASLGTLSLGPVRRGSVCGRVSALVSM